MWHEEARGSERGLCSLLRNTVGVRCGGWWSVRTVLEDVGHNIQAEKQSGLSQQTTGGPRPKNRDEEDQTPALLFFASALCNAPFVLSACEEDSAFDLRVLHLPCVPPTPAPLLHCARRLSLCVVW